MQVNPQHAQHAAEAASRFLPHGYCFQWNQPLLWTHVGSDLLIGLSYVAISFTLVYLVRKGRHEFPFQGMFVAFGVFIVACGATHFIEILTLWRPEYWLSAAMKVVTAAASVTTAIFLPPVVPTVLRTVREARLSEERRVVAERVAALVESEERFRTLAEALPQLVWTAGPDGAVEYYNQHWYDFTGQVPHQAMGWGWKPALHPDDEARTVAMWTWSVQNGEGHEIEHRLRRHDGEYRWMLTRGVPVRRGGEVVKWFGTTTDVHQQREAAEQMRTARDAAEEASRAKDQFMAMMSHELRTPLNAILGYSELIAGGLSGPITPAQAAQLERIRGSTHHLLGVIDQILSVARDTAGVEMRPEPAVLDPAEPLRQAVALAEPQAAARGLALRARIPATLPQISTDAGMLRQIVLNLLGNAVKYTPSGCVELVASNGGATLTISVSDTGIGIAPEHHERIFEPFWQADQTLTRQAEGTGLGLAVTRRLVTALGGEISFRSAPGEGSTFTVILPVAAPVSAEPASAKAAAV